MYTPIRQLMKSAINQVIYYRQRLEAINASLSSRKKKKIPNQVVLVADKIHIRINKISWALLKNGWNVIIVLKDSEYNRSVNLHCSSIFYFENIYHALLISSKFSPVVYHIFSSWNFDLAYFFIKNRPGKIIFDNMDMLTGILKGDLEQQYKYQSKKELFCYIYADAICTRNLEPQYLKRVLGYTLPKAILFSEYCWHTSKIIRQDKLSGIHVVYCGGLDSDPNKASSFQYDLARLLSKENIYFHIYCYNSKITQESKAHMDEILDDSYRQYVQFHDPVAPEVLPQEISKYHYGIIISSKNLDYENSEIRHKHYDDYFSAAKVFDYIEAGLFVLMQDARYLKYLIARKNLGKVVYSMDELVSICNTNQYNNNDVVFDSLYLENNINRLESFYMDILNTTAKSRS